MYPEPKSRSAQLFARAQQVMPGGNSRHTVFYAPYPIYVSSGYGCRVTDVDGNSYLDFMSNASASIHGHSHPEILQAMRDQLSKIVSVSSPTEIEIELAEAICARLPSVQRLRFCNSGSEAVMFALKAARAFTGRPKIAKVEGAYHGAYDAAEASMSSRPGEWGDAGEPIATPYSAGTPVGTLADVVILPFNDAETSIRLLDRRKHELAAVLVDPLVSRLAFTLATRVYLSALRDFCDRAKVVLVFDEVFSFRMGFHGAQGEVQIAPDLTALGKTIGGGLPIGAVGGRADIMSVFDQRTGRARAPHGGTFNANPLTMAAGLKALELLTPEAHQRLRALGDRLRAGLDKAFVRSGVEGQARGYGSMTSVLLSRSQFSEYRGFLAAAAANREFGVIHHALINRGILIMPGGGMLLSTPMSEGEIDHLIDAFGSALETFKAKRAA